MSIDKIIQDKENEQKENYNKTKNDIQKLLATNPNGNFTHNIISMSLSSLAKKNGNDWANRLIDELNLPYNKA